MQAESIPQNQINAALAALAARQSHPELTGSTVAQYNAARKVLDAMAEGMPMDKALKAHSKGARGRTVDPSEVVTAALTVAQHQFASTPVTEGPAADVVANAPDVAPVAEGTKPTAEELAELAAERLAELEKRAKALVESTATLDAIAALETEVAEIEQPSFAKSPFIDVGPVASSPDRGSLVSGAYAASISAGPPAAPPVDTAGPSPEEGPTVAELFGDLDLEGRKGALLRALSIADDPAILPPEIRGQLEAIQPWSLVYNGQHLDVEGTALEVLKIAIREETEIARRPPEVVEVAIAESAEEASIADLSSIAEDFGWSGGEDVAAGGWFGGALAGEQPDDTPEPATAAAPEDAAPEPKEAAPATSAAPAPDDAAPEPVVSETPDPVTHEVATESEAPLAVEAPKIAAPTAVLPASRPTDPFADAAIVPAARPPEPKEVVAAAPAEDSITEPTVFTAEQEAALKEVTEHIARDGKLSGSFLVAVDGDGWFSEPTISLVTTGADGSLQVIANPTAAQAKGASFDDSALRFLNTAFNRATRAGETSAELSMGDNIQVNAEWTGGFAWSSEKNMSYELSGPA